MRPFKYPFFFVLTYLCHVPQAAYCGDVELGRVNWLRDLDHAKDEARKQNKPLFILFQEVPGCSTCKHYGSQVLSHPLIVEAIESYFVPVCIFNNKGGKDRQALEFFGEPSWNNPVVRMVYKDLSPLVGRINGDYSSYGLVSGINAALIKLGQPIPEYLSLLEEELLGNQVGAEQAVIGMYCFWSGEKSYGKMKGVLSTSAGFMNGSEVVTIRYNPRVTNLHQLIREGRQQGVADKLYESSDKRKLVDIPVYQSGIFKKDAEDKYYLYQSPYKYLPMTALQATRANSLLADGKSCDPLLSPRQLQRLRKIKELKNAKLKNQIGQELITAWYDPALPQ